jgi:hypothetical protein
MTDVTARPWWRWESMVGAVVTDYGAGVRVCGVTKDYLHGAAVETPAHNHGPVWMRLRKERCTAVDTEDAATLGCLTQRARELNQCPGLGFYCDHVTGLWLPGDPMWLPPWLKHIAARSEWAALVAACDAAPHR